MNRRLMAITLSASAACGVAVAAPGSASAATGSSVSADTDPVDGMSAAQKSRYDKIKALLPDDWKQRQAEARTEHPQLDEVQVGRQRVAAAIDPDDYVCNDTPFTAYADQQVDKMSTDTLLLLQLAGALDLPTYDAILNGKPNSEDYPLPSGSADTLTSSFGYAQRFWDVRLNDVKLMGMNGSVLTDVDRMAKVYETGYGLEPTEAVGIAQEVAATIKADKGTQNGNNPVFTLNAFAFSGKEETDPAFRKLGDKMVFGEGLAKGLKSLGLNKIGMNAVLGHEMAHHVQYEDDLFDSDLTGAEATRRTELMADAFGTYFTVHKKGLGVNATQALKVEQTFYDVGDCSFSNPNHHGTPKQRQSASAWGAATVAASNNPLKVLPSLTLATRFEKALPTIVAPDAPTTVNGFVRANRALVAN